MKILKSFLFLMLAICICTTFLPIQAFASGEEEILVTEQEDVTSYLAFTKLSDGTYSVKLKDKNNAPAELVIPETYNGASVTAIATKGFKDCASLVSLVIPEGMTKLDTYAFYNCANLKTITIPSTVNSIGNYSFYGCKKLETISYNGSKAQWETLIGGVLGMPTNVEVKCAEASVEDYLVFSKLSDGTYSVKLKDKNNAPAGLVIPETYNGASVTAIATKGFKDCASLVSVDITEGMTKLDTYAFYNCANLKTITIPSTVNSIGNYSFYGCKKLETISYNGIKAQWEKLIGGVLGMPTNVNIECQATPSIEEYLTFTKISDNTYSVKAKDISNMPFVLNIPATYNGGIVTQISSSAFQNCANLITVTVPDSVTSIDIGAFNGCNAIEEMTLPFTGYSRSSGD